MSLFDQMLQRQFDPSGGNDNSNLPPDFMKWFNGGMNGPAPGGNGSYQDPDGTMHNPDGSVVPDTGPGGMTGRIPQPGDIQRAPDVIKDPNAPRPFPLPGGGGGTFPFPPIFQMPGGGGSAPGGNKDWMNNGKGTAPLSDQDFQNTIDRINELQKESQNYPTPISGSNPNDPTRNELNVLYQRMTDAGYEPVMHTMGGGGGSFMDAMGKAAGINPPQQGPGTPPGGQPRKFDPHDPGFLKSLLGPTYKSGKNDWYNQQQGGVGGDFGNALNAAGRVASGAGGATGGIGGAIGSMVGGGAGSGLGAGFGDTMSKIAGGAGNYFNKDNGATR